MNAKKVGTDILVALMIVAVMAAAVFISKDVPTVVVAAGLSAVLIWARIKAGQGDRQQ